MADFVKQFAIVQVDVKSGNPYRDEKGHFAKSTGGDLVSDKAIESAANDFIKVLENADLTSEKRLNSLSKFFESSRDVWGNYSDLIVSSLRDMVKGNSDGGGINEGIEEATQGIAFAKGAYDKAEKKNALAVKAGRLTNDAAIKKTKDGKKLMASRLKKYRDQRTQLRKLRVKVYAYMKEVKKNPEL